MTTDNTVHVVMRVSNSFIVHRRPNITMNSKMLLAGTIYPRVELGGLVPGDEPGVASGNSEPAMQGMLECLVVCPAVYGVHHGLLNRVVLVARDRCDEADVVVDEPMQVTPDISVSHA